ncbi:MAG: glycosyltransferase [Pleurocapsa sp. MO_192.B19]|nr:glycosyltransferase [Pleurocapsa sp. MO_192.B19]
MTAQTTIVFTTHNRANILRQAIQAAQKQSVEVDILVMDDASTDETPMMMAQEFPEIPYHRSTENKGPCYQRNQGIKLAKTEIVFPLDDDSILQSPYTLEQTLAEFDDPHIAAIAIPFINILQDRQVWTKAPDCNSIYFTHAYVAAAHAIRRSLFLQVGGYREFFFYMGEEGDLSIRLLQHGFGVRLGNADPIHHLQPPNRISPRADTFGRQNDILFVHCNTPLILLFPYLFGTIFKGIVFGFKVQRYFYVFQGFFNGLKVIFQQSNIRQPVSLRCFKLYRNLKKYQAISFNKIKLSLEKISLN